jgi:acyl-CoA synthetase (AMP-forming)/AMP-acid ligase II
MIWRSPYAAPETVPALVDHEVLRTADRHAARAALTGAVDGRRITFAQLADGARRLAAGLGERGIGRGDRVTIVAGNCPDFAVAAYGVLAAGAAVANANPALTAPELARMFTATRPKLVFADARSRAAVAAGLQEAGIEAAVHTLDLTGALLGARAAEVPGRDPGDEAFLFPSSGTTGLPKLAVHTHASTTAFLQTFTCAPSMRLTPADVLGVTIPLTHLFGSAFVTHGLCSGARVVTSPPDLEVFLRMLHEHAVTVAPVTPPLLRALAQHPLVDRFDLSALRLLICSAAPCPAELQEAAEARLRCRVTDNLGTTEAWCLAAAADPPVRGSVGRVCAGLEATIVDPDTGAALGAGEAGELWVRGPQVMAGYLGGEDAVDEDGWLHTGDLCSFDAEGNLFVADRLKDLIKVCGYSVSPAEVERELAGHRAVADAAVTGRPDPESGEVPVAYVALGHPVSVDELQAWLADRLAPWKRPREIVVVDRVPRTPAGKLMRRALAAQPVG